jgi:hypothetical protein
MNAMPPTGHAKLTPGQRRWLYLAVAFAACDLIGGLWLSLANLTAAAAAHGWRPAWLLATMIDLGVPTYVIVDHLLVILGHRSLLPRLAAWSFAGATVALNGAVSSDPAPMWRAAHMAAPAAWVLGIEILRLLWQALRKGEIQGRDRAPLAAWAADLPRTVRLQRRRLALGVRSWSAMCRLEEARLLVADLAAARTDTGTGQPVPAAVRRTMVTGWLPADLAVMVMDRPATEWEPAVTGWAARQMALPETLLAAVTAAAPAPPAGPLTEGPAGGGATPSQDTPSPTRPGASRAPSRKAPQRPARLTPETLADLARKELPLVPVPSVNELQRLAAGNGSPVGRPKAQAAHAILDAARVKLAPTAQRTGG